MFWNFFKMATHYHIAPLPLNMEIRLQTEIFLRNLHIWVIYRNCLIDTIPTSPQSLIKLLSNSNFGEIYDFCLFEIWKGHVPVKFHTCWKYFLLKHGRNLIFSQQVVNIMTKKIIIRNCEMFWNFFKMATHYHLAPLPSP